MSSSLWLSIEPSPSEIRLLLAVPQSGTALKARLPPRPARPRALAMLMEALSSVPPPLARCARCRRLGRAA
jgi:hypothetical protein